MIWARTSREGEVVPLLHLSARRRTFENRSSLAGYKVACVHRRRRSLLRCFFWVKTSSYFFREKSTLQELTLHFPFRSVPPPFPEIKPEKGFSDIYLSPKNLQLQCSKSVHDALAKINIKILPKLADFFQQKQQNRPALMTEAESCELLQRLHSARERECKSRFGSATPL